MALLGAQLVITLVMVSIIQKLGPHYSLARWILCSTGLIRYLYPTDDELRALAGVPKDKAKGKKGGRHIENGKTGDTFHIPRSLDVQLETTKVTPLDVVHLRYYTEYQWLVDFALYSTIVYTATEVYQYFFPLKDEFNLSMLWCFLVVGFALKLLVLLTVQYFHAEESVGERSTVIVTGFAYLLVAMMILIVDENTLELGLDKAYKSFNESAAAFLDTQGLDSKGPASKLVLKFFLALWCGLVGAVFTFPGLRMSRMHWDSLRYCGDNRLLKIALNLSFAFPLLLIILWVKPICRDYLTARVFTGMTGPLDVAIVRCARFYAALCVIHFIEMTETHLILLNTGVYTRMTPHAFESLRLIAVVVAVLLRLILMPVYLQAYLNMAYHRIEEQKKEAGRITNLELQKKVAAVFYYLCVVTLQYVAPIIMCLFFTFMYKTLGGYAWDGLFAAAPSPEECPADAPHLSHFAPFPGQEESITHSAKQFTLALDSMKQIFTTDVFRGLLGFATWWSCFAWFATTSMGMVYQTYFGHT